MRTALVAASLICACATTGPESSLPEAVSRIAADRFNLSEPPVFLSDSRSCQPEQLDSTVKTISLRQIGTIDFAKEFPQGIFVLCRVTPNDRGSSATLQRLLFSQNFGETRVSDEVSIALRQEARGWRAVIQKHIAID